MWSYDNAMPEHLVELVALFRRKEVESFRRYVRVIFELSFLIALELLD